MTLHEDRLWDRWLRFLDTWATVTALGPGRVCVRFRDRSGAMRAVEIIMTAEEWDDIVSVTWGSFEDAAAWIKKGILDADPPRRFMVYQDYDLVPSDAEDLPVRELPKLHGRWVVLDDDGNVVDELR